MDKKHNTILKKLVASYYKHFGYADESQFHLFFSPGRINVIGEHIDYNGGKVFPAALEIGMYGLIVKRDDSKVRAISLNFEKFGVSEGDLEHIEKKGGKFWLDYIMGVAYELQQAAYPVNVGFNLILFGNIPNSSGLSSSASIEVLTAMIMSYLNNLHLETEKGRIEIAKLTKKAENEFVGVNSGIMDQFAIVMGKAHHAIYLDTGTLEYEYVPFDLKEYVIVIVSSNKKRALITSKYGERREQCETVVSIIQKIGLFPLTYLCDLNESHLERIKPYLDNVLFRRARHVITENIRAQETKAALVRGDLKQVGLLLNASHESLRDDYEVTGIELDTIYQASKEFDGCIGARMTGAGFGGCAIALVEKSKVKEYVHHISQKYLEAIGYACTCYISKIGDGTYQIF